MLDYLCYLHAIVIKHTSTAITELFNVIMPYINTWWIYVIPKQIYIAIEWIYFEISQFYVVWELLSSINKF